MDEAGSDDTISLRACAAELRPEEARVAFSAANAGRKALKDKRSGIEGVFAGIERAARQRRDPSSGLFDFDFEQVVWSSSPEAGLVRSSLLSMATAIVDAAVAGRTIWRGDNKLPVSFFVTARDDAVQMIAEGLEQDDKRFKVHASAAAKPHDMALIGGPPTYREPVSYSADKVPEEFKNWAQERHDGGFKVSIPTAHDAMAGLQDAAGKRHGGKLPMGRGLARRTIGAWVKSLPDDWVTRQGETLQRPRRRP